MRPRNEVAVAMFAAAVVAACGSSDGVVTTATPPPGSTVVLPTFDGWTVGYDPASNPVTDPFYSRPTSAAPSPAPEHAVPGDAPAALTAPPESFDDLALVKADVQAVNAALDRVFGGLQTAAQQPATDQGSTRQFAPVDLPAGTPAATFRLTARYLGGDRWAYRLEAKPLGAADDAYQAVLAGTAGPSSGGRGVLVMSVTNLHAVNPTAYPATGRVIVAARQGSSGEKSVLVRITNFVSAPGASPVSGVVAGDRTADGVSHVRDTRAADVVAGPALEKMVDRISWKPNGGGRGLLLVTEGDVDAGTYLLARSCWTSQTQLVFREWRQCASTVLPGACIGDPATVVGTTIGAAAACQGGDLPVPATAGDVGITPTETAPFSPPQLPADLPLDLPQS